MSSVLTLKKKQEKINAEVKRLQAEQLELAEKIKVEEAPSEVHEMARNVCNALPAVTDERKDRSFGVIRNRLDSLKLNKLEDFKSIPLTLLLLAPRIANNVISGVIFDLKCSGIKLTLAESSKEDLDIENQEDYNNFLTAFNSIETSRNYFEMCYWVALARDILFSYCGDTKRNSVRVIYGLS